MAHAMVTFPLNTPCLTNCEFYLLDIFIGLQHRAILCLTPFGLPLDFSILPEKLKEVGKQLKIEHG